MKANFLGATVLAGGALAGVTSEPKPVSSRPPQSTIQPTLPSIYAAAATAVPQSPVSNVAGKAFDRIIQIWLENTDYNVSLTRVPSTPTTMLPVLNKTQVAAADPSMQWIASQGILLSNYFAGMYGFGRWTGEAADSIRSHAPF